jgi:hypothetical protein
MPLYRVTIRHGRPQQYVMDDIEASSLAEAMCLAAEQLPVAKDAEADLVEIRIQSGPEGRSYVGE